MDHIIEAVFLEHLQGLDNLQYVYTPYFQDKLSALLKKPPSQIKQRFLIIKSGRESCAPDFYSDIFSSDQSLRTWIGLASIK